MASCEPSRTIAMIASFSGPALAFISVDFASLQTSVKRKRRALTLGVLVLANTVHAFTFTIDNICTEEGLATRNIPR